MRLKNEKRGKKIYAKIPPVKDIKKFKERDKKLYQVIG